MRAVAALLLYAGCGRLGFDPPSTTSGDSRTGDDSAPVTPPEIVGSTEGPAATPGAAIAVDVPTTVQPDDLLLLGIFSNQINAQVGAPSEWQPRFDQVDSVSMFRASFFWRRSAAGDPATYSFTVASSNLVGWVLVAVRNAPMIADTDQATFVAGTPNPAFVLYQSPIVTASAATERVVWVALDDSGTAGMTGNWSSTDLTKVADGLRAAVFTGTVAGPGPLSFVATIPVPGTTLPNGAGWILAWPD